MNSQTSLETRTKQYEWLKSILDLPAPQGVAHLRPIVIGHWGVYSYVGNGNTYELIQNLEPILKQKKVYAYFSGHDHCLQHIYRHDDVDWKPNYFVSGAGGYPIHVKIAAAGNPAYLKHVSLIHGFMAVQVTERNMEVKFITIEGKVDYTTIVHFE